MIIYNPGELRLIAPRNSMGFFYAQTLSFCWCQQNEYEIGGCPLSQFLSLRDYESCFSEREMATVFLLPKMLKHDSYEKEITIRQSSGV